MAGAVIRSGDIVTGNVRCESRHHVFPIVFGRPILMHPGTPTQWLPPINEAQGLVIPESLGASLQRAMTRQQHRIAALPSPPRTITAKAVGVFRGKTVLAKARYRLSGRWFRHRDRTNYTRWVAVPTKSTPALHEFYRQVVHARPRIILDLASGGGGGINAVYRNIGSIERCYATERDINCLWTLQYKFATLRSIASAEAVGRDVHRLPFGDGSFDTLTCYMSFGELTHISVVLSEAHRVLRRTGALICVNHRQLFRTDHFNQTAVQAVADRDLRRFAKKVDVYNDYRDFETSVRSAGFRIGRSTPIVDSGKEYIVHALVK